MLLPQHDNAPYDLVIDIGGEFYPIQIKTAYTGTNNGAFPFETRTTRVKSAGYEREGYVGKIDLFAVYSPKTGDVYLIEIEDAPENTMTIRYEAPSNGNRKGINWHADYLLDSVLPCL